MDILEVMRAYPNATAVAMWTAGLIIAILVTIVEVKFELRKYKKRYKLETGRDYDEDARLYLERRQRQ